MKMISEHLKKASAMLMLVLGLASSLQIVRADVRDVSLTIANQVQVTDRILEFDLLLRDTDVIQEFELNGLQVGITMNPTIYNGGSITVAFVSGSSELVSGNHPASIMCDQLNNIIKLTPAMPTAAGSGTIIATGETGTRVYRIRVINSEAFTTGSTADLTFSFTDPYPTHITQIIGNIAEETPTTATNCTREGVNIVLNPSSANGPVTTISSIAACAGSIITVPVKVSSFINVGAVSLTVTFDPAVIDFISGTNTSSFPGLSFYEPQSGTIKIAGYSSISGGVSYSDNTVLCELTFAYSSGTTILSFVDDDPSDSEYATLTPVYTPFNDIPSLQYYVSGQVTGASPVSTVFSSIGPFCHNSLNASLPLTSSNNITGIWSPSTINTSTVGSSNYTFTPYPGQCASPVTIAIDILPFITPLFEPIGPLCMGSQPQELPERSTNNIPGSWSPATINTTNPGSTAYTFTPDAGLCATPVQVNIIIVAPTSPSFNLTTSICQNSTAPELPLNSSNGIPGTWDPPSIETSTPAVTTYKFTPVLGQCATQSNINVTIVAPLTPVFTPIAPVCQNSTPPVLPLTSLNGIPGTWEPAAIVTSVAGTTLHTFTPTAIECVNTTTMNVIVKPLPTATLSQNIAICNGQNTDVSVILTGTSPFTYFWSDNLTNNYQVISSSTTSTFSVSPSINTSYTITNVTDATGCTNTGTGSANVFSGATVTGNVSYLNNIGTKLNNIQVKLSQAGQNKFSCLTNPTGDFTMINVCPGEYTVTLTSTAQVGGVNSTDAALVNAWGVGYLYDIAKVKFLAGNVVGNDIINSADAASILTHFITGGISGYSSGWTFANNGELVTENIPQPTVINLTVPENLQMVNMDLHALVKGDFNCSFTPAGLKSRSTDLVMNIDGTRLVQPGETFDLPILSLTDMQVGAISLVLDFPADRIQVLDANLGNNNNTHLQFATNGNELRIGWFSAIPFSVPSQGALVTLKLKVLGSIGPGDVLSFNLASNTLSELANGNFEPITDALLAISDIRAMTTGTGDVDLSTNLSLTSYPNPFIDVVTLSYNLPVSGIVTIQVYSMSGIMKEMFFQKSQTAGDQSFTIDLGNYQAGVYSATLTLETGDETIRSSVMVVKN